MRESVQKDENQKRVLLEKCFDCLVATGIEGASVREFQNATGMNASSLYYWFSDKDEIVFEAVNYGVNKIVKELFEYVMCNTADVDKIRFEFPRVVMSYKKPLKAIFQVVTSPKYGEAIIRISHEFNSMYDEYAKALSEKVKVPYDIVRLSVDLLISSIVDCVMWDEEDKLSREIDTILYCLKIQINEKGEM